MHETSVAQSIIESITTEAERIGKKPVHAKISCGQLNALNDEVMQFAFEVVSKGTACEGMTLAIEHYPLRATCRACAVTFDFDIYSPLCPQCQSTEYELAEDAPLLLEEIEFLDE